MQARDSRAYPEGTAGLSPGFQPMGVKISDAQLTSAVRCRRTISVCTLNPKTENGFTTDSADSADSIGYDWTLWSFATKRFVQSCPNSLASSKSVKSAESAVSIGI